MPNPAISYGKVTGSHSLPTFLSIRDEARGAAPKRAIDFPKGESGEGLDNAAYPF